MRTFIAIELPAEIRDSLARIEERLKATQADVKWVEPKNIHLTLKFLGEIDEKQHERINLILDEVAGESSSYKILVSSIGAFPKLDSPRVIWVGADAGDKETKVLAKELEEKIQKIGIPKEDRPFSSHITIGRTRSTKNRDKLIQELRNLEQEFGGKDLSFPVKKITLCKSTLTPQGPIYEVLKEANLKTI